MTMVLVGIMAAAIYGACTYMEHEDNKKRNTNPEVM